MISMTMVSKTNKLLEQLNLMGIEFLQDKIQLEEAEEVRETFSSLNSMRTWYKEMNSLRD